MMQIDIFCVYRAAKITPATTVLAAIQIATQAAIGNALHCRHLVTQHALSHPPASSGANGDSSRTHQLPYDRFAAAVSTTLHPLVARCDVCWYWLMIHARFNFPLQILPSMCKGWGKWGGKGVCRPFIIMSNTSFCIESLLFCWLLVNIIFSLCW